MIILDCVSCGRPIVVGSPREGKRVKCYICNSEFTLRRRATNPIGEAVAERAITSAVVEFVAFKVWPRWRYPGEELVASGYLYKNGAPWAGQTVHVLIGVGELPSIGSAVTGADGSFEVKWPVPFEVYCPVWAEWFYLPSTDWAFYAYHAPSGTMTMPDADDFCAVAHRARIRDFTAPDFVRTGDPFPVSGYLEYETDVGVWEALGGKTVSIYYNDTLIGSFVTDIVTGYFEGTVIIDVSGDWTLKAYFPAEGLPASPPYKLSPAVSVITGRATE